MGSRSLKSTATEKLLRAANRKLLRRYGTPRLGNKRHPVSELVFIILSARTRGRHHEATYRKLRRTFPTWDAVQRASVDEIERVIHDAGLSRIKARQIKDLLSRIAEDHGDLSGRAIRSMEPETAERYLTTLPGVGLKTARCVMMYSLGHAVFPVDTHCIRLFANLGIIKDRPRFEYAQDPFQAMVPSEIRHDLHVNTVAHGRQICVPGAERCSECVISKLCVSPRRQRFE